MACWGRPILLIVDSLDRKPRKTQTDPGRVWTTERSPLCYICTHYVIFPPIMLHMYPLSYTYNLTELNFDEHRQLSKEHWFVILI